MARSSIAARTISSRIRLADTAGVTPQEAHLQLLGVRRWDRDGVEAAEAGVDAVGVLLEPEGGALDQLPRGPDLAPRLVAERDGSAFDRDAPDVLDGEVLAGEDARVDHGAESIPVQLRR